MSESDQLILEAAVSQIEDCLSMAQGDADNEGAGVTVAVQVEMTREAIKEAMKVLTKWRRKAATQRP
jgi:hypothetical protein